MKFIKKPIPVEAVKCIKENEEEIIKLLESGVTKYYVIEEMDSLHSEVIGFNIESWEGAEPIYYDSTRNKNNKYYWIIKGIKGEIYPCVADDEEDAPLGYMRAE